MDNWEKKLEESWGRPFVHESGHALMALLQELPCSGIGYEKGAGTGKFFALIPSKPPDGRAKKDYLVAAAGIAAELLLYGDHEADATGEDQASLRALGTFEETVREAREILSEKKRPLKRIVSLLKMKVKEVDLDLSRLPETGMIGSEKKYAVLLSNEDLQAAMNRR